MYEFEKTYLGRFTVHKSVQLQGDRHFKRFTAPGTTPASQGTLNVYVDGQFQIGISAAGFSQTLNAGQTSLDLTIAEFPLEAICIETVLSTTGTRYCIGPTTPAPWTREARTLQAGTPMTLGVDAVVFIMSGQIEFSGMLGDPGMVMLVPANTTINGSAALVVVT
jgi:hypothetical protein